MYRSCCSVRARDGAGPGFWTVTGFVVFASTPDGDGPDCDRLASKAGERTYFLPAAQVAVTVLLLAGTGAAVRVLIDL